MGEPEDCEAIAKWSGRDVILLHTETDRCTIIPNTANAIEEKTVAKLMKLDWTREPSRDKHGIYVVHDGIHYNVLKLRNSQEQGEHNIEENIRESTNKTKQSRRKRHATPNTQDTPPAEDTHEEGDDMRATNVPDGTQDNPSSIDTHGEGEEEKS